MAKKKVFVSFDYENDRSYKYLLEAWDANTNIDFLFSDFSSREINSWNVSRVKAALSAKIAQATYTLVIIGKYANVRHRDYMEIGYKNWINFEIARSKDYGNKLVAVKIDNLYESPDEIMGCGASWAKCFKKDSIIDALYRASLC